ncbi:ComEC/Rec2 family competence protein [Flavobacterium branchiophilum]|uniref:Competence protein ComEC n=1 Tax=Flavobacterium branchiophilum (strain FL-15) TaxID=1034807 RepID=G2Z5C4_FLABF|nr:ComEC/Rec2 family competence protein [Flavobacterium branchiophilum]CCB68632.1 Probable transmembrane protein of unknown function [Flavobacterium branchiophilum FL-15]
MKFLDFPLARITLFFVFGVFCSQFFQLSLPSIGVLLLCCFVLLCITFYLSNKDVFQKMYFGLSVVWMAFWIGFGTVMLHNENNYKRHFTHNVISAEKDHFLEFKIAEKIKSSTNYNRYVGQMQQINGQSCFGKFIVNISKDSVSDIEFQVGTTIKVHAAISNVQKTKNPSTFDYAQYLKNKQIYGQIFISLPIIQYQSKPTKSITYYAQSIRDHIEKNLYTNGLRGNDLAVVMALILGQQQDISQELVQDYQAAGAVHILSVSGLHVGLIMWFITFILSPISNTPKGRFTKLIILLLMLWAYGFLAGFAPSILRSVVMFSFVAVGKYLGRCVNFYHTLLVSMLLILLYDPFFLFDIGFQLSYISLFFIVWMQPLWDSVWEPQNPYLKKYFWDVFTVSTSAQLGTFPLSLYYFHQFPALFLVTNLLVLPLIAICMAIGVPVLIMAACNFVSHFWLMILKFFIALLNQIISWVASFETFVFSNIPLHKWVMLSLYLMLVTWIICFKKRHFKTIRAGLISILIFQLTLFYTKYHLTSNAEMVVFDTWKQSIVVCKYQHDLKCYMSDTINKKSFNLVQNYAMDHYCNIQNKNTLPDVLSFNNKKIFILQNDKYYPEIAPDILLLVHSPKVNLERYLLYCKPKMVVADGSNYKSAIQLWKQTCQKAKIPFHATAEKGYFKL